MKQSLEKGFSFGLVSGVITTLGLIIGLFFSTDSEWVVLSGILIIAIADSFSDASGVHISEESTGNFSVREIWETTISTLFSKFFFAMSFALPVLFLELHRAIMVDVVWGLFLITSISAFIAQQQGRKKSPVVIEHLVITVVVITLTFFVGRLISQIVV